MKNKREVNNPRGKPTRHLAEDSFSLDENHPFSNFPPKIEASLGELNPKEIKIINFIKSNGESSSKEIFDNLALDLSYATPKRVLTKLISEESIESVGKGKGTKYIISSAYELLASVDLDKYFEKEIDDSI